MKISSSTIYTTLLLIAFFGLIFALVSLVPRARESVVLVEPGHTQGKVIDIHDDHGLVPLGDTLVVSAYYVEGAVTTEYELEGMYLGYIPRERFDYFVRYREGEPDTVHYHLKYHRAIALNPNK